MILSASRRTDIPAFYSEWFFNRIREGYVLVRNPMNCRQVSRILLTPDVIDCIVFWTKDPTNMLDKLDLLRDYSYYFLITLTPYDRQIERNVADKAHIIEAFRKLSSLLGKKRIIWRYDPVILSDKTDIEYHRRNFEALASKLEGCTERCIVSFMDLYKKTERNMKSLNISPINGEDMLETGRILSEIASRYGLKIEACSEELDLSSVGIGRAKCIDDELIAEITGKKLNARKDRNQRDVCRCAQSVDVGAYNTCRHGCLYCYANYSDKAVESNILKHDPKSPMLIGNLEPGDRITDRKIND